MKAKVWMAGGKVIIQTDTTQWQLAASMTDLMAIRNGRMAVVELTSVPKTAAGPSEEEGLWARMWRRITS